MFAERFCKTSWCWILFLIPTSEYWCSRCHLWGRTCRCRCSRRSRSPRTWTAPRPWSDASWRRWRSPHRLCSPQRWSDRLGSSRCWCSRLKQNKYLILFKDLSLTVSRFRVLRMSTKAFHYVFFSFYHRHQPKKAPHWTIHTPVDRIKCSPFSEWGFNMQCLEINSFAVYKLVYLSSFSYGQRETEQQGGSRVSRSFCQL